MATVYWLDGFELYTSLTHLWRNYTAVGSDQAIETTNYRTGAQALRTKEQGSGVRFIHNNLNLTTMTLGFATKTSGFHTSGGSGWKQVRFIDDSLNQVIHFGYNPDGRMAAYRGSTLLGTTTNPVITTSGFNYIEIKVYAHQTAGTVEIRLNGESGTPELSLSGIDTIDVGTVIEGFDLFGMTASKYIYYDDLYFATDFLGDSQVDVVRVTGAGNYAQFAPSAGSNYQNVDESPGPDDDTTYNDGDALNEMDAYQMGDLSAGGTIHALKSQMNIKKTEAGTGKAKHVLRINSSDYLGDEKVLTTSYTTENHIWNLNPDDSNAFETADINALELGVKVTGLT